MRKSILAAVCVAALALPSAAAAQLRAVPYVSGLSLPVAFVQDPADPANQYVVQQGGRIRLIRNGTLQTTPFLDVSSAIVSGGEQGLLGMAPAPDYATSGRFYVNFTDSNGNTVVARFKRSTSNPLVADPASRFDLRWSTGNRFIAQPFANHNGGMLLFGPDGYLYIGMGDGGSGNDPQNNAQNMSSLLGKLLRIDVSVPDSDANGFAIPADNPFRTGSAPEIWDIGLRNPWKFTFDDRGAGATSALIIADVGQGSFEEIDYERAAAGGINWGWRNREGAHNNVTSIAPAFQPLVDPIFEYDHSVGQSITGGYVYRGSALGAGFAGRYFFADFVQGRIFSIALAVNSSTGLATASDLREHTSELASGAVSTFGRDAAGELYFANYGTGAIFRIDTAAPATAPIIWLDTPAASAVLRQPFFAGGWAIDTASTSGSGIDAVHLWAYPASGNPVFAGAAQTSGARPDIAAAFGSQFANAGFGVTVRGLRPGNYTLVAFGLVHATGVFSVVRAVPITVVSSLLLAVDAPANGATVNRGFVIGGWAIDGAAVSGTGVDAIHVWAYPVAPAAPVNGPQFVGAANFGNRPDVAAIFGQQFLGSGWGLFASSAPLAGVWDLVVFAHSSVTGNFDAVQVVRVTVR